MKKKLTIALLLFIASSNVFAQKFRFGLSGNTGYAWLKPTIKGLSTNGGQAGFGYGLMFDYNLSDNYAITSGLEVNYRGGGVNFNFDYGNTATTTGAANINLQYIEIPLQLKMKTKAIGYFTYYAAFGGSAGYALSRTGNYSLKEPGSSFTGKQKVVVNDNLKDFVNPFALSLLINLGTEYNISGKTSLVGSLFFNNCFTDVLTDVTLSKLYTINSRANVVGLKLGIFF